jgi:hypothetical protein
MKCVSRSSLLESAILRTLLTEKEDDPLPIAFSQERHRVVPVAHQQQQCFLGGAHFGLEKLRSGSTYSNQHVVVWCYSFWGKRRDEEYHKIDPPVLD